MIERHRICSKKQGGELKACIAQSLRSRIVEFRNVLDPGSASPQKTVVTSTEGSPMPAPGQKADCPGESGPVDRAICGSATLAHWEDRLGKSYQQALDDPPIRTILADDQKRWTTERAENCGALPSTRLTDCVLLMTKRRLEQLVQVIRSRDDPGNRASTIETILSGQTPPPPGLDADTIDRESNRAEQSELVLADTRICIRRNAGSPGSSETSHSKRVEDLVSTACFGDFSKRMSALDLGALAKSSFDMLVRLELGDSQ
jgi:uncharacterized protein YecT (DUF1311 family)